MAERITSGDTVTRTARPEGDPSRLSLSEIPSAWDRYEILELLGAGGMGKVYKAKDRRLNRHVALKFIRENDPDLVGRFFREAESQAKIDHENICKVYEVGEVQGKPYIAMQHIAGESLKAAKASLTITQKLSVMIDVCAALHAAHEGGLIHRDIKPANIMIERAATGALRPSVLDFGLAREVRSAETWSSNMEGTPAYMAPEQARGSPLDRRTDVYGLGATLYDLLAGRPPYVGATSVEVILALAFEEVPRLRAIEPKVPHEVELIVMKCLDRDPARRYPTAKALADDLNRYLQGEPVEARAATIGYVLAKKAKKHKAFVAISLFALVAVSVAASFALRARLRATAEAELAHELGQNIKGVELFMAYARALPRHDTTHEKALIRAQINQIDDRMKASGAVAEGPCHYAVGRGLIVLGKPEDALRRFEEAWARGYRTAEVELGMGRALGALYTRRLNDAQRITDPAQRDAERRRAEQRYLAPALTRLARGGASILSSPAYTDGLIAFYRGELDTASERARAALAEAPWLYEAIALTGDVHHARGVAAQDRADPDAATSHFLRAVEAYRRAQEMARSDAALYDREAESWTQMMEITLLRGEAPGERLDRLLSACDKALEIDPNLPGVRTKKSLAHLRAAISAILRGKEHEELLNTAIDEGKKAINADPRDWMAHETLGSAEVLLGDRVALRGGDPSPLWGHALSVLERAVELNPNFAWGWNDLGLVYVSFGQRRARQGQDPSADLDRGISLLARAATIDPGYPFPLLNICYAELVRGRHELRLGASPRASVERALASCEHGMIISAPSPDVYANIGVARLLLAEHLMAVGADPKKEIAFAIDAAADALDVTPSHVESFWVEARANLLLGQHELSIGADPGQSIERGKALIARAIELAPDETECRLTSAELCLTEALWITRRNEDPSKAFARAFAESARAVAKSPGDPDVFRVEAEIYAAKVMSAKDRDVRVADIRSGIEAAERALAGNPLFARAHAALGKLRLSEARATGARDALPRAKASFARAIELSPGLSAELSSLLAEASK